MHGIAEWLEGQGFGEYAEAFARNKIDRDVLPIVAKTPAARRGVGLPRREGASHGRSEDAPAASNALSNWPASSSSPRTAAAPG